MKKQITKIKTVKAKPAKDAVPVPVDASPAQSAVAEDDDDEMVPLPA